MSALPEIPWTGKDYLAFERESDEKHEFVDGVVYAMTGASERHNLVTGSAYASLYSQLRKRPCRVYPSDMRVKVAQTGIYTYPDISIVCEPPRFEDDRQDTLLNPVVLIEVLSPSTENYDRGKKFQHYRTLESLQEYLLIAQDSPHIEHYRRQADNQWLLTDVAQADAVIELPSIACTLALADVYEKVDFEEAES
ncbi:MAG: Uma2 family endonuclease [Anaerolineaceae bacterium]|nr:Uma2 family endonuclease [Anaerolineaceae bacterium]